MVFSIIEFFFRKTHEKRTESHLAAHFSNIILTYVIYNNIKYRKYVINIQILPIIGLNPY